MKKIVNLFFAFSLSFASSIQLPNEGREPYHEIVPPLGLNLDHQPQRQQTNTINSPQMDRSIRRFSVIDPSTYFDREEYLRTHVQGLVEDEDRFGLRSRIFRGCYVTWNGLSAVSTATSLIFSTVGASEYIDPQLANIITSVLAIFSGGCIWAATQSKKISHQYHIEQVNLQESLGVPSMWRNPEVRIEIDQFNGRQNSQGTNSSSR